MSTNDERLGSVTEAGETLGIDAADVFEMAAAGLLRAERDEKGRIVIYRVAKS